MTVYPVKLEQRERRMLHPYAVRMKDMYLSIHVLTDEELVELGQVVQVTTGENANYFENAAATWLVHALKQEYGRRLVKNLSEPVRSPSLGGTGHEQEGVRMSEQEQEGTQSGDEEGTQPADEPDTETETETETTTTTTQDEENAD